MIKFSGRMNLASDALKACRISVCWVCMGSGHGSRIKTVAFKLKSRKNLWLKKIWTMCVSEFARLIWS